MKKEAKDSMSPSSYAPQTTTPPLSSGAAITMTATLSSGSAMSRSHAERRTRNRIHLAEPIVGRVNSFGAVLVDISEGGARIEHYHRMKTGSDVMLRFEWEGASISTACRVVTCRVHRFASGDDGITVFQSGLAFVNPASESANALRRLTSTYVARALAEQVANAKGVIPIFKEDEMPIFRAGVLSSNTFDAETSRKNKHLIPGKKLTRARGYIRCTVDKNGNWKKKWTMDAGQPEDGFTVSMHEPLEQIDMLCATYRSADADGKALIRKMAALSVEEPES
jgi:hypothetical protein